MVTNTEARATNKQLWYLHILTKQDTREWLISMKEASDMITVLKARKIELKQRIGAAAAPVKELTAGPDPVGIVAEFTEIVNDIGPITTMPVTFHYTDGREVTVNQAHYLSLAPQIKQLEGNELPKGYGVTNMPYVRRNFMFVYCDNTWRDWSIGYANKLRNPNYQYEIESQGIEVRQLCEVN